MAVAGQMYSLAASDDAGERLLDSPGSSVSVGLKRYGIAQLAQL